MNSLTQPHGHRRPEGTAPPERAKSGNLNDLHQGTSTSNWVLIRRLLSMSWGYRGRCLYVLVLQTLLTILGLMCLNFVGLGVDVLRHHLGQGHQPAWPLGISPPAGWSAQTTVWFIAGLTLVAGLTVAWLQYTATVARSRLVQDLIVELRTKIYNKLQRLSFRFFDANETGSIINRVTGDVQGVRMFLQMVVMQSLTLVICLCVFLTYMLSLHVWLTLACMATIPLLFYAAYRYGNQIKPAFKENRRLLDDAIRVLSENIQGVHVIKGFARQGEETVKFERANQAVCDHKHWIFGRQSFFAVTVHALTFANQAILLAFGGYLVIHGQFPLGTGLLVFWGLLGGVSAQVQGIAQITNSIQQSLTGAERMFEVLDAPVEIHNQENPKSLPERPSGEVTLQNVSFSYKDHAEPALKDVSFTAQAGQCVALLGPCGAGKSTLLSLIPRFYDPQEGTVSVDGIDVRDLDLDELRRCIGLVFQESFLFSNTVAANIAFGHPKASQEQIEKAARIACAHDFIMELPKGYQTVIGENGVDLSGGQRQRLAIARALLLEPPILLMDDPTAAIDPETEHEILQAMDNAMKGRTTFLVAHRLSTLRRAHQVIVLDKGRLVQQGTHDELITVKGLYRKAAKVQTADAESRRMLAELGFEV